MRHSKCLAQEQKDVLLTADIGGTNCRFSLWQANIKVDVVYDEIFTKVHADEALMVLPFNHCMVGLFQHCIPTVMQRSKWCLQQQLCNNLPPLYVSIEVQFMFSTT